MNTRFHPTLLSVPAIACIFFAWGLTSAGLAATDNRLAWYQEARLGMFIHWGLYSVPAGEWQGQRVKGPSEWIMKEAGISSAEYEKLAPQFNPVKFDARQWVAVARTAGMRYIVITAKHHDGFNMHATKLSPYNVVEATPFKRDPLKELAAACREAGIVFCVYYSISDWHHPEFPAQFARSGFHSAPNAQADLGKYADYVQGQIRELLTDLGPIGVVWCDFDSTVLSRNANAMARLRMPELYAMIHRLQPACLVPTRGETPGDFDVIEQRIPGVRRGKPFEVAMTLSRFWGYNRFDQDWKSPALVIRNIVDIVSKGGNYLLNVGPTAEGVIPQPAVDILKEVGAWTAPNGEALYGVGPTPFGAELGSEDPTRKDKNGKPVWIERDEWRCTTKPGRLYFHLLKWPGAQFTVPAQSRKVVKAYLLADPARTPLAIKAGVAGTTIALPANAPAALVPVLCVEIQ